MVSPQLTVKLAQTLEAYITWEELSDFASIFEVEIHADRRWLPMAKGLTDSLNQENTRFLVEELVGMCETRNSAGIAHTTWERRDFHYNMAPVAKDTRATGNVGGTERSHVAGRESFQRKIEGS